MELLKKNGKIVKAEETLFPFPHCKKELFDKNGKLSERIFIDIDGKVDSRYIYKYEKGNLIESESFQKNGEKMGLTTYINNLEGKVIEKESFNYKNKIGSNECYFYDENGSLIELIIYSYKKDKIKKRVEYINDSSGNVIEETHYENEDRFWKNYFVLDNKGNRKEIYTEGHHTKQKAKLMDFKYDEYGNVLESIWYKNYNDSLRTIYKTTYDENKNWVKTEIMNNGKPYQIVERKIKYF